MGTGFQVGTYAHVGMVKNVGKGMGKMYPTQYLKLYLKFYLKLCRLLYLIPFWRKNRIEWRKIRAHFPESRLRQ